jgi:enoyl-CoA hydratase/carnithine racemase
MFPRIERVAARIFDKPIGRLLSLQASFAREKPMPAFNTITVTRDGQIATLMIQSKDRKALTGPHIEIGAAISELRYDNGVRVVIITGTDDAFFLPPKGSPKASGHTPGHDWDLTQGMHRTYQSIIEIEKPVIAKVNGNAIGFGSSLAFACDLIIANEDAIFCDHHLAMGKSIQGGRSDFGTVPGDGGTVFVPLHMSPCLAKEYLWLAREMTGKELAAARIINAAVSAAKLDATVDAMAKALIERTPYSLALAKRATNKSHAARFNLTYDLAWSYELLNFFQHGQHVDERGVSTL